MKAEEIERAARAAWDEACDRAEEAGKVWQAAGGRKEGDEYEAWKAACAVSAATARKVVRAVLAQRSA